ncbi:MAG: hypothetical protein ACUVQR_15030 [Thermogutta sp.]
MGDRLSDDLDSLLREAPESLTEVKASRLAIHLKKLAGWVLAPDVLAKARAALLNSNFSEAQLSPWQPPLPLPQDSGACWLVAVRKSAEWRAVRKAFVLPLRWKKNPRTSAPPLPEGLKKVADCVIRTLRNSDDIKAEDDWQLFPAVDGLFDGPALEVLEGTYDSAWVPLASALLVAAGDGKPDRHIWATGAWKDEGGFDP